MKMHNLRFLRRILVGTYRLIYIHIFKMDIHPSVQFSLSAKFDLTNPKGVHIGEYSYIAFDAAILTHDMTRGVRRHTRIGKNCFIGARSVILPGVTIGDNSIIGACSLVNNDVPSFAVAVGNPAVIVKRDISVGKFGRFLNADQVQAYESATNGF